VDRHRNKVASIAFTGAAAAMTVGMVATQAQAASSWHIKNNGTGYTGPVKGKNNGNLTLKDTTTGATLTCKVGTATGNVSKSKVPAVGSPKVASITGVAFSSCTIGGTIPFTAKTNKAMNLHAKTYNGSTGTTTGFLGTTGTASTISATITGKGNNCKATVVGSTLPGSFNNGSHNLIADKAHTATLKVKTATSCGLLHTGDKAYFSGKFVVTTPSKLTISKQ
jgi:hypothetical protein